MKTSAKRAIEQLTLTPNEEFTMKENGFVGTLYRPEKDEYPGKAVIMFGGSDGIYPFTRLMAEKYVKRGMAMLALAYWNEPGLPDCFEKIPVEVVEKAALWLWEHGYEKVGLWGISMGAELALLAGSLMPELISCVTAVCPINICGQGFIKKKGVMLLDCSAFSWRGKEIPWARLRFSRRRVLRDSLREKGVCLRSCYENAVLYAPEEAQIKVENIDGPVLLFYPEYDVMWPSELAAKRITERLKKKDFAHLYKCVSYRYASHMLIPVTSRFSMMFKAERKYPEKCRQSDTDAFEKTLVFWKEVW